MKEYVNPVFCKGVTAYPDELWISILTTKHVLAAVRVLAGDRMQGHQL